MEYLLIVIGIVVLFLVVVGIFVVVEIADYQSASASADLMARGYDTTDDHVSGS